MKKFIENYWQGITAGCLIFAFVMALNFIFCEKPEFPEIETTEQVTTAAEAPTEIKQAFLEIVETTTEAPTETTTAARQLKSIRVVATAYCPCVKCCGKSDGITATGTKATAGRTIAVDPSIFPYGTKIVINGNTYTAEDCGGAVEGNKVDIFFNTHEEALNFGRQVLTAYYF